MTLNLTLLTPGHIIQTSDRRMVSMPDGKPINNQANKDLVLEAADGIFAITFAGVGLYRGERVDLWLGGRMLDEGVPELPINDGLEIIRQLATDWFRTFPETVDKRHTFVVAGWDSSTAKPRPAIWTVTNCTSADDKMLEQARDVFHVRKYPFRGSRAAVHGFGLHQAIARSERRRLEAALRKSAQLDRAEEALVAMVRAAAHKPKWSWGINGEVMSIALSPHGQARCTFYSESAPASNYAPLFVWYEAGRNIAAGDVEITPAAGFGYRFGKAMLVASPGGAVPKRLTPARDDLRMGFRLRVSEARFHTEPPGLVPIVQPIPIQQR